MKIGGIEVCEVRFSNGGKIRGFFHLRKKKTQRLSSEKIEDCN
jgi:hypothetical protein